MIDVQVAKRINAATQRVADVLFNPRRDPEWMSRAERARPLSALPLHLGSRVRRDTTVLGRPFSWVTEVVRIEPGRSMEMRVLEGPFWGSAMSYDLAAQGVDATWVVIRSCLRAPRVTPFGAVFLRAALGADLDRLKGVVEAEP